LSTALLALSPGQLPLLKVRGFALGKATGPGHSAPRSQVGSALFAAPEVMHNFSREPYDGRAADVWSLGVVLFVLLFGRHPLLTPEDDALPEQQQALALFTRSGRGEFAPLSAEERASVSGECLDLVTRLLQTDPRQRAGLAEAQAHPWFRRGLPEGAAVMNATVLAEERLRGGPRQRPEELERMVAEAAQGVDAAVVAALRAGGAGGVGAAAVGRDTQRPAPLAHVMMGGARTHGGPVVTGVAPSAATAAAAAAAAAAGQRAVVSGAAGVGAAGQQQQQQAVAAALARAPSPLSSLPPASALPTDWERRGQHAMAAAAYFDNSESGTGGGSREAAAVAALQAHEGAGAAPPQRAPLGAYVGQESFCSTIVPPASAPASGAAAGGGGSFSIDRLTTADLDGMMAATERLGGGEGAGNRAAGPPPAASAGARAGAAAAASGARLSPIASLPVVPSLPPGTGQIDAALAAIIAEEERKRGLAGEAEGGDGKAGQDDEEDDDPYADIRDFIVDEDDLPPVARGISSAQIDLREMSAMIEGAGAPCISAAAAAAAQQQQQKQAGLPPAGARVPSWFDVCRQMSLRQQQLRQQQRPDSGAAADAPSAANATAGSDPRAGGDADGNGDDYMDALLERIGTLDQELRAMSLAPPVGGGGPPRLRPAAEEGAGGAGGGGGSAATA
jgi:hypothetical protein